MDFPGIQAIFFDAVGTLIHPEPAAPQVYADIGRRFGSCWTAEMIGPRFLAAFQREEDIDRAAGWRTSEDREYRRWRNIVAAVLDDVTDAQACFQDLYEHFRRPQAWQVDPDTVPVLQVLAAKGYSLGLASNYDQRLRAVWAGVPELQSLQHLVISSEIGWRKPAPQFFASLCQKVNLPPDKILYVGDDPLNDYEGARSAALSSILFAHGKNFTSFSGSRILRLVDLLNL